MVLAAAALERAMKIQEVIVRALSGTITWLQADPGSVRRWRAHYEAGGYDRRGRPLPVARPNNARAVAPGSTIGPPARGDYPPAGAPQSPPPAHWPRD
jgi:hypothetical protein